MELKDMCRNVRDLLGGVTQKRLAAMIGTNQTEISFIERGFIPKQEKALAIEKLYKHAVEEKGERT